MHYIGMMELRRSFTDIFTELEEARTHVVMVRHHTKSVCALTTPQTGKFIAEMHEISERNTGLPTYLPNNHLVTILEKATDKLRRSQETISLAAIITEIVDHARLVKNFSHRNQMKTNHSIN